MIIELLNEPTLKFSDWAAGECYDKGCYTDKDKMIKRLHNLANVYKHTSILEFITYNIKINWKNTSSDFRDTFLKFFENKYIMLKHTHKETFVQFNARTLKEIPFPKEIYDVIPPDHKFLIGFKTIGVNKNKYIIVNDNMEAFSNYGDRLDIVEIKGNLYIDPYYGGNIIDTAQNKFAVDNILSIMFNMNEKNINNLKDILCAYKLKYKEGNLIYLFRNIIELLNWFMEEGISMDFELYELRESIQNKTIFKGLQWL